MNELQNQVVPTASPLPPVAETMMPFAGSSFWSLPREEQERMMRDLDVYRRELPRLLAEGAAGRFCIIKDGMVASIWDTARDAMQGAELLYASAPVSLHEIKPQDVKRFEALSAQEAKKSCQP